MNVGPVKRVARVLIGEENRLFRCGLRALIASDPWFSVVAETGNAEQLLTKIRELRPDLVVLDLELPGLDPEKFRSVAMRSVQGGALTLALALQGSDQNLSAALSCGARGLTLKSAARADLLATLRSVAFQEGGMNSSGLLPDFRALERRTRVQLTPSTLTAREQEVMRLLAEGRTVRMVATELSLSMKTVEAHKLNLMRKLDIHDRPSLVAYANRTERAMEAIVESTSIAV